MKKCPSCDVFMNEVTKADVLIDICPKCEGIWLDKGELDKILARNRQVEDRNSSRFYDDDHHDKHHHYDDDDYYDRDHHRKRRGGFLENLFD
ncbi:MAG: zf-TFIIB domain-containing protein [Bacteroidota bacterium]|nr:zf-TFIIB domain-containing protein [Bacteroidota bacterium]MDP4196586.1 zf-TFIIB domain-containing protein [Bacteroidota bacterium]